MRGLRLDPAHVPARPAPGRSRGRIEGDGGETLERRCARRGDALPALRAPAGWCAPGRRRPRLLLRRPRRRARARPRGRRPPPRARPGRVRLSQAAGRAAVRARRGRPARRPGLPRRRARRIGARAAWERPGGTRRRRAPDRRRGRLALHPPGPRPARRAARRAPEGDVDRRNHGTNVLGMLLGVHDGRGVDGICPADRRARGLLPARGPLGQRPRDRATPPTAWGPATSCSSRCSGPARARSSRATARPATCR